MNLQLKTGGTVVNTKTKTPIKVWYVWQLRKGNNSPVLSSQQSIREDIVVEWHRRDSGIVG